MSTSSTPTGGIKPMAELNSDQLKAMFDASVQKEGSETSNFSTDEKDRFVKAFDDPEFRKLFSNYMDELQDPANRAETETYISQLENDGKTPQGKELIRPAAGFVVKTYKTSQPDNTRNTSKETGEKTPPDATDKVFVNIVQSDKINAPIRTPSAEGVSWSVPYSVGPVHMEIDKAGAQNVPSFDCCFHPEALDFGAKSKQFRDLLIQTAFDGIEASYKRNRLETTLERKAYHVLKGVTYKSGSTIPTMMVDTVSKDKEWTPGQVPLKERAPGTHWPMPTPVPSDSKPKVAAVPAAPAPPAKSATTVSKGAAAKPAIKKGFLEKAITKEAAIPTIKGGSKKAAESSGSGSGIKLPHQAPDEDLFDGSGGFVQPPVDAGRPLVQEVSASERRTPAAAPAVPRPVKADDDSLGLKASSTTIRKRAQAAPPVQGERETVVDNTDMDSKTPRYVVSEKGNQNMVTQEFESVGKQFVASNRPVELVYRVELPKVVKSSQVELDVQERRLVLSYLDVYRLDVDPLPYPVFEGKGNAKYDKVRKTLTVTLPVRPAPVVRASLGGEVPVADDESTDAPVAASFSSAKEAASKSKGGQHNKWVAGEVADTSAAVVEELATDGSAAPVLSLAEEIRLKSQRAMEEYEVKKNAPAAVAPAVEAAAEPVKARDTAPSAAGAAASGARDFYPSKSFAGKKPGFVFKRDEKLGLGYHRDVDLKAAAEAEAEASSTEPAVGSTSCTADQTFCRPFGYDYRQHNHCLSVVINVAHIRPDSVQILYSDAGASVKFRARKAGDTDDSAQDELFGLLLLLPGVLEEAKCKYDVAANNMVLILTKAQSGPWTVEGASEGAGGSGGLTDTEAVALLGGGAEAKGGSQADVVRCSLLSMSGQLVRAEDSAAVPAAAEPIELVAAIPPPPLKAATPGNSAETLEMVERNISDLSFANNTMIYELD